MRPFGLFALLAYAGCSAGGTGVTDDMELSGEDAAGPVPDLATAPGDASVQDPTIVPGAPDRLLLLGQIVTPDVAFAGQVLVEGDKITCVEPGEACAAEPGAMGATVIDTHGVIAPGMVDAHNHILFDIFDGDDWLPNKLYSNHDQWPNETRYKTMLDVKQCLSDDSQGKPVWCPVKYDGAGSIECEIDKYGELKGLVAGTTSIVGLPGANPAACYGSLARTIDSLRSGLPGDVVRTSSLFPPSTGAADGTCTAIAGGTAKAYLIHCGEGLPGDAKAAGEFARLGTIPTMDGCLYAPQTAITHGTAFTPGDFAVMKMHDMKLTWSPASNVALYGTTTDIPAALAAGVQISIGPDWSMGGSQNMLDELRFADAWDAAHFGDKIAAKDLVTMATANGAAAVGRGDLIGSIKKGYIADLFAVAGEGDPYAAVVRATPREVLFTMVGGRVLYGDAALAAAGPAQPGCEMIDVCGKMKFLCVAEAANTDKLGQTFADIKLVLETGLAEMDALIPGGTYKFSPLTPLVKCN